MNRVGISLGIALIVTAILGNSAWADAAPKPEVQFDVVAQQEVKATAIELNFSLQTKASSLESAAKAMQALAHRVQTVAREYQIPSSDVDIQNTTMASSEWLFGQDYGVAATAKITLRNLDKWPEAAKKLTQLDNRMHFDGVSYAYPKTPEVWNALLLTATKEAQDRELQYERLLNVKLTLSQLREMRNRPQSGPMFFQKRMMETAAVDAAPNPQETLPTQTYQLTLDLAYTIQ